MPQLVSTLSNRPLVWIVVGGILAVALAGCLQRADDHANGPVLTISRMNMETMDPAIREQVRNQSVHVDPDHAQARVPYFVDALRRAAGGELQGIGDRDQQEAVIAYLREISEGQYLPPVEFEGSYFDVNQLVT